MLIIPIFPQISGEA